MTMDWFRSWHNAPTDPKWLLIARRANVPPGMVSAVFWELLDYASQEKDRGSVAGFDHETYAGWAGWEESDVLAILDAMRSKGVITTDNRLSAWNKRQPKREDETGADRQAKHRDNRRNASNTADTAPDDVTQSNAKSRRVTQKNARLDSDKTRLEETRNGNSVSKEINHSSNGRSSAEDALIDPELAQALGKWKEVFTGTPWEANPPVAQIPKWLAYGGPGVLCHMIEQAKDKQKPGGWLWQTYDNWRQEGEIAPFVLKQVEAARLAAQPVIMETKTITWADGTTEEREVATHGS